MTLLRSRGFLLLWLGQFLVILSAWSTRTVLLIWVYQLTHSGVAVSIVGLAEAVPLLITGPLAGVLVDRWNRAYTMAGSVLCNALLMLPLLMVTNRSGMPVIIVTALFMNTAGQLFMTAAAAALPVVVTPQEIGQANGMTSLLTGAIAMIGPGAAALLFATAGPHGTIVILSLLLLLSIPVLAAVPASKAVRPGTERLTIGAEMLEGLRYVGRSPLLVSLVAMAFVAALGIGALSVLDVVFVTRALHLRSEAVGLLLSSSGIGELTGGVLMSVLARRVARKYHALLGLSVIVSGIALLAYSISPFLWVAALALFVVGLSFPPIIVAFMTMLQYVTEDAFMGRVNSVVNTGMAVAMIGSLIAGGALTDLFGVRQVIAGAAVMLGSSGVLSLALIRSTPAPRIEPLERAVEAS